ncbi:MAG: hypothetical protein ACXWRG_15850 [Bdellovibrio sp.]
MHGTEILRTLKVFKLAITMTVFISFSCFAAKTGKAENTGKTVNTANTANTANTDVYTEFQKKIEKLNEDLKKEKDKNKRYDLFLKTYADLSNLRAKNPRQAEEKELNMSYFMDALSDMPEKKNFQEKKCFEYQKEVKKMMTSPQKNQKEPFIEKAFEVVDLICR